MIFFFHILCPFLLSWVFVNSEIKIRFWPKKSILIPDMCIFWEKIPFEISTEMLELSTEMLEI